MEKMFQVGWYNLQQDEEFRENSSFAAWYTMYKVKAGKYPVYAVGFQMNERERRITNKLQDHSLYVELKGTIVNEYYAMHIGGVPVGGYAPANIGKEDITYINSYCHSVAKEIVEGTSKFELFPQYEAMKIQFDYEGESLTTYGIFKKI